MQAPRSPPESGAGASATTGLRQAAWMPLPPARMQAPVPTRPPPPPMPPILLGGNANAYPPIAGSLPAGPLERCDSLNSLLATRQQAAASAFTPIPASSNMIAMLEAEDKQAGTPKKVRVTGSQTESDDDGTEPQDVAAGARSFGDNDYAASKESAPSLQLSGKVGVGTRADMIQDKEMIVEKLPPRNLGRLAGEDITARIDDNNRAFFDGTEMVRKGCLRGGGVSYVPAYDAYRMAGAGTTQAKGQSQPDALVADGICTYHDIVMAKTAPNVSAAPKICMDQNLYWHMRNVAFQ